MINICGIDEILEKYGPRLSHESPGSFQFPPSFGFLLAACRAEQQISANNTSEALGNPGMTLGRNLDCLVNSGEGNRNIAIQSVGICQISQNTRFIFQAGLSRSSKAEGIGQVFYG